MSIKIYNDLTNIWEKQSSMMAASTRVVDVKAKFKKENTNVEACLEEVKDDVNDLVKDVKFIYENGTIGGGGGGNGGSSLPVVTIIAPDTATVYVTSSEVVELKYSFTSPNRGGGTASITAAGKINKVPVSQNTIYTTKLGPFKRNSSGYKVTVNVVDSQGFGSVPEEIIIISGAIDISSTFDPKKEFTNIEDIEIPLLVECDSSESLNLECMFRGSPHPTLNNSPVKKGLNTLKVGKLVAMGVSKISFKVGNDKYSSNELRYNLIASDSINLYISSEFEEDFTWKYSNSLKIDYRLSKRGEYQYLTNYYIDDMITPAFEDIKSVPSPNVNYWDLGTSLSIGNHHLRIVSKTLDAQHTASLDFNVTVTADGFEPHPVTPGAIAYFKAEGKQNSGAMKTSWKSEIGNMACSLHGFNYETNGFFDNSLKFEGKSYGVIDYVPFANGLNDAGFTFEITYKARNTGDNDARVMHCKNENNNQGMFIDTEFASFQTKSGALAKAGYEEDTYITKTFVIDPTYKITLPNPAWENDKTQDRWLPPSPNGVIKVFTNASITAVDYFDTFEGSDFKNLFKYQGKILLGARCPDGSNGQDLNSVGNFGSCNIKSIRIYNKFLTDEEVLNNYISLQGEDKQRQLLKINDLRTGDFPYAGIATVDILDDLSNLEEGREIDTILTYTDHLDSKNSITVPAAISWQGTSSKDYPVKNYTIKMYAGSGGDKVHLVTYAPDENWLPEYRWTLKANYMDSSQANNVGAAKFIHDFTKGKHGNLYPQQNINPKTRNCVDGIPVRLRINDENFGVYTFNIDRYAHQNYGLSVYEQIYGDNQKPIGAVERNHATAVSYEIAGNNTPTAGFNTKDFENIKFEMKHRFNYREKEGNKVTANTIGQDGGVINHLTNTADHSELMSLMEWMADVTPQEFWLHAKSYWSIPHLIDYYLICQMFGMVDSLGKNMVITTFGPAKDTDGNIYTTWFPHFYDCDTIMGINNTGQIEISPGIEMSEYVQKDSKLWTLLTTPNRDNPYPEMIARRYTELRRDTVSNGQVIEFAPFAFTSLIKSFETEVIDTVGQKFYNQDAESKYIKKRMYLHMCSGSRLSFTRRWLKERLLFLDSHYESAEYTSNRIALRSNVLVQNGLIRIKTYSPQKIKIQFQDGAEFVKLRCDRNGWTEFKVNISNIENNNTTIYGADNIMDIEGIKNLNISFLDIQNAKKLSKLDLEGNNRLTSIIMNNNKFLRTINLKNCTGMGTDDKVQRINVAGCDNIRSVDISNTKLQGIDFSSKGGYIDTINISSTPVKELNIVGQGYLDKIISSSNDHMTGFQMKKCNAMKSISIVNSKLDRFIVEECENLTSVDISGTAYLDTIRTILCPNLTSLSLARVNGTGAKELDLTTLLELTTLNISHSSIKHIKFGQYTNGNGVLTNYNKLKSFNADGSAIISIGFGVNASFTPEDKLNLGSLQNLTSATFAQCKSLKYVENMNINGYTSFHQCGALVSITGKLTLSGSINSIFYGCGNLTGLPTFNISGVTSMDHTFYTVSKITMAQAKTILSTASSSLTNLTATFRNCAGLVGQIPDDMFSKCTHVSTINYIFGDSINITGGIKNILAPMGNALTNCTDAFKNTSLTECPTATSFASLNKITSLARMFNGSKLNTAPEANLFTKQKQTKTLTSLHGLFAGCPMTGTIPETIFHGLDNLTDVAYFFSGSKLTGIIPPRIFDFKNGENNSLTNADYFFNSCSGLTGTIPENLFKLSPNLKGLSYTFNGCSGLTGRIPTNLLASNNYITNTSYMFNSCSSLGKGLPAGETCIIPPNFFKKKSALQQIQYMFSNCPGITGGIAQGMFDDCVNIYDITATFNNCTGLTDQLPVRVSTWTKEPNPDFPDLFPDIYIDVEHVTKYGIFDRLTNLRSANYLFKGCENLVSTIPPTLFKGGSANLTQAIEVFSYCYRINGAIPKELFANLPLLDNTSGCFTFCRSLKNTEYHDPNAEDRVIYIFDPELFANNPKLANVSNMFNMYQEYPPAQVPLIFGGVIPPGIFRNNTELTNASSLFTSVSGLTGTVDSLCFNNCVNLESVSTAFHYTGITGVARDLFTTSNRAINFYWAFIGCSKVTSQTFDYDKLKRTPTNRTGCFSGTTFTNLASVPAEWK